MSDDSYKLTIMDVYNGWIVFFFATVKDVQDVVVHSSRRTSSLLTQHGTAESVVLWCTFSDDKLLIYAQLQ